MIIVDFQKHLRHLYTEEFKGYTSAQEMILRLGYAIKRMVDEGRLTPFDDYEKNKERIYEEMEWVE